jgi:outer membrane protein
MKRTGYFAMRPVADARAIHARGPARAARAAAALIGLMLAGAPLAADPRPLTPEDAVAAALAGDPRILSASLDLLAAQAKAREAELRRLPSVSLSAGYTRLSHVDSSLTLGKLGTMTMSSLDNSFSLAANLQYPVFAGFRLMEAQELARVQAQGKEASAELIKRSLVFETERAYWEARRASFNADMLKRGLELAEQSLAVSQNLVANGSAMKVDLLSAQMRRDQAAMDLAAAANLRARAFWNLAVLVAGSDPAALASPDSAFTLATDPRPIPDSRFPTLDEAALVQRAIANRPETRALGLATAAAEVSRKLAEAPLYPTLAVTGSALYADPNPRVAFQTDETVFTGTWSLGVSLSWDLGGLPANLAAREAQIQAVKKGRADEERQKLVVALDVRSCLLTLTQARADAATIAGMIEQARENERVVEQRVAAGTASDLDLLTARLSRLKAEFAVTNRLIDGQVAAADLERAAALAAPR